MTLAVPLAVRLKTGRADRHVTRELRDISYRSAIPGGFASAQMTLDRPLSLDPEEIRQFGKVYIYDGRNGRTVWYGRLEDPGRGVTAEGQQWTLTATGAAAHVKDRTVPLIYVDTSWERWHRFGLSFMAGRDDLQYDNTVADEPRLILQCPRGVVAASGWQVGREYRHLRDFGQKLARVASSYNSGRTVTDWRVQYVTRDGAGGSEIAANGGFTTTGSGLTVVVVTNFANGRDLVEVKIVRQTSTETVANDDTWSRIGVGPGIVVRAMLFDKNGNEITTGYTADTVLASEVVADLLGRLLNKFDGANASIATTTFAIPHLAYPDGTTAEKVLSDLMGFESTFYWAAWEPRVTADKAFFEWRSWPTTVRYEATAADGFDSPGSAGELYDRVKVRWRDANGRVRFNTRTQTVAALADEGLPREALIDLGDEATTSAAADRVGDQFLLEHAAAPNAGSLTVRQPIFDATSGRKVEPWEIQPGHLIRVRDVLPRVDGLNATSRDAVTIFRLVGTDYRASDNSCTLELDSRPRQITSVVAKTQRDFEYRRRR